MWHFQCAVKSTRLQRYFQFHFRSASWHLRNFKWCVTSVQHTPATSSTANLCTVKLSNLSRRVPCVPMFVAAHINIQHSTAIRILSLFVEEFALCRSLKFISQSLATAHQYYCYDTLAIPNRSKSTAKTTRTPNGSGRTVTVRVTCERVQKINAPQRQFATDKC